MYKFLSFYYIFIYERFWVDFYGKNSQKNKSNFKNYL